MSIAATFLPEFEREMAATRRVLAGLPDDRLHWKPHPKTRTMGELASHIASIPGWLVLAFTSDALDAARDPMPREDVPPSTAELVSRFETDVDQARTALQAADDDVMRSPWRLSHAGKKIFEMPRTGVVRGFALSHLIHHRAQLSLYLRLADLPVPAIYGPTGDDSGSGPK